MIDATLENTASMFMSGDFDAICSDGVVNKLHVSFTKVEQSYLYIRRIKPIETFLDNVVAIQVFCKAHDLWRQSIPDKFNLALLAFRTLYTCSGRVK